SHVARRHAISVMGLVLILAGPVAVLLLPRSSWWQRSAGTVRRPSPNVVQAQRFGEQLEMHAPAPLTATEFVSEPVRLPTGDDSGATGSNSADSAKPIEIPPAARTQERERSSWNNLFFVACVAWLIGSLLSSSRWFWQLRQLHKLTRSLEFRQLNSLHG